MKDTKITKIYAVCFAGKINMTSFSFISERRGKKIQVTFLNNDINDVKHISFIKLESENEALLNAEMSAQLTDGAYENVKVKTVEELHGKRFEETKKVFEEYSFPQIGTICGIYYKRWKEGVFHFDKNDIVIIERKDALSEIRNFLKEQHKNTRKNFIAAYNSFYTNKSYDCKDFDICVSAYGDADYKKLNELRTEMIIARDYPNYKYKKEK